MKTAVFVFLLAATVAVRGDAVWKEQTGRFAIFQTPPTMTKDLNAAGVDFYWDAYQSPDIHLDFDSEARTLPPTLQKQVERTTATWAAQRKEGWRKSTYVEDGGAIHGSEDPKHFSGMRYYLYLGFSAGESNTFAVHVRFHSLDRLDDIERILKSIKIKAE